MTKKRWPWCWIWFWITKYFEIQLKFHQKLDGGQESCCSEPNFYKIVLGSIFFPHRWRLLPWKMLSPTWSLDLKTELSTGVDAAIKYCLICFCFGVQKAAQIPGSCLYRLSLYHCISNSVSERRRWQVRTHWIFFPGLSALPKSPPRSATSSRRCLSKNLGKPQLLTLDLICMVL